MPFGFICKSSPYYPKVQELPHFFKDHIDISDGLVELRCEEVPSWNVDVREVVLVHGGNRVVYELYEDVWEIVVQEFCGDYIEWFHFVKTGDKSLTVAAFGLDGVEFQKRYTEDWQRNADDTLRFVAKCDEISHLQQRVEWEFLKQRIDSRTKKISIKTLHSTRIVKVSEAGFYGSSWLKLFAESDISVGDYLMFSFIDKDTLEMVVFAANGLEKQP